MAIQWSGLGPECYNQLLAEGYVTSQITSATQVAAGVRAPPSKIRAVATWPLATVRGRLARR